MRAVVSHWLCGAYRVRGNDVHFPNGSFSILGIPQSGRGRISGASEGPDADIGANLRERWPYIAGVCMNPVLTFISARGSISNTVLSSVISALSMVSKSHT